MISDIDYKTRIVEIIYGDLTPEDLGGEVLYFAHPTPSYGTDLEKRCIQKLRGLGYHVVNPADSSFQDLFLVYRDTNPGTYMKFFELICSLCSLCAVLPHLEVLRADGVPDGKLRVGAGAYYEAMEFLKRSQEVFVFCDDDLRLEPLVDLSDQITVLTIPETRNLNKIYEEYLKTCFLS